MPADAQVKNESVPAMPAGSYVKKEEEVPAMPADARVKKEEVPALPLDAVSRVPYTYKTLRTLPCGGSSPHSSSCWARSCGGGALVAH